MAEAVFTTLPFNDQASVCMPVPGVAVSVEPGHKVPLMMGAVGSGFTVTVTGALVAETQPVVVFLDCA